MTWFLGLLVVLAMGGVALVAAGRGGPLAAAYDDLPDTGLPETGELSAADLRSVRFPLVLRGYRMADVDALLDRLAAERESTPEQGLAHELPTPPRPGAPGDDQPG